MRTVIVLLSIFAALWIAMSLVMVWWDAHKERREQRRHLRKWDEEMKP
jgi:hypothetical protein